MHRFSQLLLTLLFALGFNIAYSQSNNKNYFKHSRVMLLSEIGITPLVANENDLKSSYSYFTFAGFAFEPRYNLVSFTDKASISVSAPLTARLMISDEIGDGGTATLGIGGFADYNVGNNSTYNNIDKTGFSFGIGIDFDKGIRANLKTMVSPKVRIGINSIINSITGKKVLAMVKLGIPQPYKNRDNEQVLANLNIGISFAFTY